MRCAYCDAVNPDDAGRCVDCKRPPLLEGRYRLDDRIGRGANGTVYRATDFGTGDTLAIKELPFREGLDPKRQQLFDREAEILAQLDHPAIPRFHGRVISGEGKARSLYLLQDFVEGTSLQAELARRRYSEDDVLAILAEVLEILSYLHGRSPSVIHRDLKPSNIMRRPDGRLALIDFGAVRDALRDPNLGGSTVAGTFGFMAPEQFAGDASPATDLYGLGATAVALLSRQDPAALHDRAGRFDWERHVRLSPPVAALLRHMLDPDPHRRPSDATALRETIQDLRRPPSPSPSAAVPAATAPRLLHAEPPTPLWDSSPNQPLQAFDRQTPISAAGARWMAVGGAIYGLLLAGVAMLMGLGGLVALGMVFWMRSAPPPPPPPLPDVPETPVWSASPAVPMVGPEETAVPMVDPEATGLRRVNASEVTITNRIAADVPRLELEALGLSKATCVFAIAVQPHGTATVLGITSASRDCAPSIYAALVPTMRRWQFYPAERDNIHEPILVEITVTARIE